MKKFLLLFVGVMLSFVAVLSVNATTYTSKTNPTYIPGAEGVADIFYANGNKIEINDRTDASGAVISYTDISGVKQTQKVTENVTIVGGGVAGTHFTSSNITLNGGVIRNIIGGGDGTTTVGADVDTVNVKVTGGDLTNLLFGGGRLTSHVKNATITMTGGTVDYIHGGGHASYSNIGAVGSVTDLKNSPCSVDNAVINVSGGRINLAADGYGALFGGGQGYSYVGNASINISGNVNLSTTYISLGGSNGMTEVASLVVSDKYVGTIQEIQSINRGSMKEANFEINGGTVADFYLGQDASQDTKDTANLPKAFLDGAVINAEINGGTVVNLHSGYNYKTLISSDSSLINAFYKNGTITNISAASTGLGTSLKMIPEPSNDGVISKDDINAFVGVDYDITVANDNYSWTFNLGNESEGLAGDLDLNVDEVVLPSDVAKDDALANAKNVLVLDFAYSGDLPDGTVLTYTTDFVKGVSLDLYYLNPTTNKLELVSEGLVVGNDGKVLIPLEHCSTYVLVQNKKAVDAKNPETGDMIGLYMALGFVSLMGIGAFIYNKRNA